MLPRHAKGPTPHRRYTLRKMKAPSRSRMLLQPKLSEEVPQARSTAASDDGEPPSAPDFNTKRQKASQRLTDLLAEEPSGNRDATINAHHRRLADVWVAQVFDGGRLDMSYVHAEDWFRREFPGELVQRAVDDAGLVWNVKRERAFKALEGDAGVVWSERRRRVEEFNSSQDNVSRRRKAKGPPDLVDAMAVAVEQLMDTHTWYIITSQLELVSYDLCRLFRERERPISEATIKDMQDLDGLIIMRHADGVVTQGGVHTHKIRQQRLVDIGPKSAIKVTWSRMLFIQDFNQFADNLRGTRWLVLQSMLGDMASLDLPDGLFILHFTDGFTRDISSIKWPERLQELSFQGLWDGTLQGVQLPSFLKVLHLKSVFNQPVENVVWPDTIEELALGGPWFNQPITAVTWPLQLKVLTFGFRFDCPLNGAQWPSGLKSIQVGADFHHTLEGMAWPPALESLFLGSSTWEWGGIEGVINFPDTLERVYLGENFNGPLPDYGWGGVTDISFGRGFSRAVDITCWPQGLRAVKFGDILDTDIARQIVEAKWPSTLVVMEVGAGFALGINPPTTHWPDSLQSLVLGGAFAGKIDNFVWPPGLNSLTIGDWFNQNIEKVAWPKALRSLRFGKRFKCVLSRVTWPPALSELSLKGMCFDLYETDAVSCEWPSTLKRVQFRGDYWLTCKEGVMLPL